MPGFCNFLANTRAYSPLSLATVLGAVAKSMMVPVGAAHPCGLSLCCQYGL
jgi:hypothetical protein